MGGHSTHGQAGDLQARGGVRRVKRRKSSVLTLLGLVFLNWEHRDGPLGRNDTCPGLPSQDTAA